MSQPSDDLQFDQAEPVAGQSVGAVCTVCKQALKTSYFAAAGHMFCQACRDRIAATGMVGTKYGRLGKAFLFGLGAAVLSAIGWYLIRATTGYDLGIVAIVVGLFVGGAVKKGSSGRGGLGYQLLAVGLTYTAISLNYAPDIVKGFLDNYHSKHPKSAQVDSADHDSDSNVSTEATTDTPSTAPAAVSASHAAKTKPSLASALVAVGLLIALFLAILLAAPVMIGISSPILFLIMGFGLWRAWRVNRATIVQFTGPHAMPMNRGMGSIGGVA